MQSALLRPMVKIDKLCEVLGKLIIANPVQSPYSIIGNIRRC